MALFFLAAVLPGAGEPVCGPAARGPVGRRPGRPGRRPRPGQPPEAGQTRGETQKVRGSDADGRDPERYASK